MRFDNTVTIRRSPREVFNYLAAFENVPEWNPAILKTHKTSDGPVGVGATYRQTRSAPSTSEEGFQVTEFDPHRRIAIHGDLGSFKGTLSYDLEALDDGTLLTNTADLEAQGVLRLASPIVGSKVRDAVAENLQRLKQILER
jgi:carbon monoxide dehydrogenase subunit G